MSEMINKVAEALCYAKPVTFEDMARVSPVGLEVFDCRSLVGPGIRSFGCFIEEDQFLALTWDYRENIDDFEFECRRCRAELQQICGSVAPFSEGKKLHDCLKDYIPV